MAAFDRNLAQALTRSLEKDDIKSQASRINSMMTTVSLFVQKLHEAKDTINSKRDVEREYDRLRNNKEITDEDRLKLRELENDLDEIRKLEIQYNRSRDEVKALEKASRQLQIALSGL